MINIATTLRYVNLEKISPDWEHRFYIMQDYFTMADKLGFGICAIMNDKNLERICDQCDGLIIPGSGMSYNPKYWGGPDIEPTVDEYALDAKLIDYFIRQGKPIFGICGGLQTLNIYLGGSIREIEQPHEHGTGTPHGITIEKDSFVWDVFQAEHATINTFHGWELDRIAPGFRVVARSDDGVVEAAECREKKIFATQWHPERVFHDPNSNPLEEEFFKNFIALCGNP